MRWFPKGWFPPQPQRVSLPWCRFSWAKTLKKNPGSLWQLQRQSQKDDSEIADSWQRCRNSLDIFDINLSSLIFLDALIDEGWQNILRFRARGCNCRTPRVCRDSLRGLYVKFWRYEYPVFQGQSEGLNIFISCCNRRETSFEFFRPRKEVGELQIAKRNIMKRWLCQTSMNYSAKTLMCMAQTVKNQGFHGLSGIWMDVRYAWSSSTSFKWRLVSKYLLMPFDALPRLNHINRILEQNQVSPSYISSWSQHLSFITPFVVTRTICMAEHTWLMARCRDVVSATWQTSAFEQEVVQHPLPWTPFPHQLWDLSTFTLERMTCSFWGQIPKDKFMGKWAESGQSCTGVRALYIRYKQHFVKNLKTKQPQPAVLYMDCLWLIVPLPYLPWIHQVGATDDAWRRSSSTASTRTSARLESSILFCTSFLMMRPTYSAHRIIV